MVWPSSGRRPYELTMLRLSCALVWPIPADTLADPRSDKSAGDARRNREYKAVERMSTNERCGLGARFNSSLLAAGAALPGLDHCRYRLFTKRRLRKLARACVLRGQWEAVQMVHGVLPGPSPSGHVALLTPWFRAVPHLRVLPHQLNRELFLGLSLGPSREPGAVLWVYSLGGSLC